MAEQLLPYSLRLSAQDRWVLESYVQRAKKAGRRDVFESDAIRAGIALLKAAMKDGSVTFEKPAKPSRS